MDRIRLILLFLCLLILGCSLVPTVLTDLANLVLLRHLASVDKVPALEGSEVPALSSVYEQALSLKADYLPARIGLARLLVVQARWQDALISYEKINRIAATPVTLLAEGTVLHKLGHPVEALAVYERAGYLSQARRYKSPDPGVLPQPYETDLGELYVNVASEYYDSEDWSAAINAAQEALRWTNDSSVVSGAANIISLASEAQENTRQALKYLWLSLSARQSDVTDPRYDRVCSLIIRLLDDQTQTYQQSEEEFAYVLRCLQWLKKDIEVVEKGENWLDQNKNGNPYYQSVVECLVKESAVRLSAQSPSTREILDCAMAFTGRLKVALSNTGQIMPFYPVNQLVREGQYLFGISLNSLDLHIGLPVATHFYYSSAPDTAEGSSNQPIVNLSFARIVNFAPNAGFRYEVILAQPRDRIMPIGYERDIYYAPASTRSLVTLDVAGKPQTVLELSNVGRPPASSSGLTSYAFPIDPSAVYVQGGLVRNSEGGLHLGRQWYTHPSRESYSYVMANVIPERWTWVASLVFPPANADKAALWMLNFRSTGVTDFGDLIFFKVPDLGDTK